MLPPKIRNKTRMLLLLFNIILEFLASKTKQEKDMKGILVRKEELELSLFSDDRNIYVENDMESTKKAIRTNK